MGLETLEEVGCEEKIEKIEKDGKTDRDEERQGEHKGDMSWISSISSVFKLSSFGIEVNSSNNLLWNEIDLAERYLVSAMNENAASIATTVLQTLTSLVHSSSSGGFYSVSCRSDRDDKEEQVEGTGEVGKSDREEMLECAGMVLLQSCHAIGRVGEFFEILRKLNLGVAEWPLSLLEIGACLQISDGACSAARAALEEFLEVRSTCLWDKKYAEVVELYVIKVLVKGFQEAESAMDWVERTNLTGERRLVILKKIYSQTEQAKTTEPVFKPHTEFTPTASGDTLSLIQASLDLKHPVQNKETKEKNDVGWKVPTCLDADESSITSKSLTLLKRFKISEGFFSLKSLLEVALARLSGSISEWQPFSAANMEAWALRFGALVALFLFIFLRYRNTWGRMVGKSLSVLRGLGDLWQLAFSVQINPLALVNPITTAY